MWADFLGGNSLIHWHSFGTLTLPLAHWVRAAALEQLLAKNVIFRGEIWGPKKKIFFRKVVGSVLF